MNQNMIKINAAMVLLAVVASGCGGGGDSSPVAAAPVVAPAPVVSTPVAPPAPVVVTSPVVTATASLTVPIVTSVPTPTYAVGSEELAAFNLLNAERSRCGFGMLAQNAALDFAAKSHADWLLRNGSYGHYEAPGTPLYTGVDPASRFIAANYALSTNLFVPGEVATGFTEVSKSGYGVQSIRNLFSAPYHMLGILERNIDVGIALRSSLDVALSQVTGSRFVADFGIKAATPIQGSVQFFQLGQSPGPGSVRTYPCEGTNGVAPSLFREEPSPVPGRDLSVNPVGTSVGVVVDAGHSLTIRGATMTNVLTGENVLMRPPYNYATDGNAILLQPHKGFVTADSPLATFTPYKVIVNGEDNGVAFSRTFTFTTGAVQK